ncbi:MAG TPA: cytochrome b/b6 domain-containing protein [Rhodocyclaceae bacterium]|nr:cytochrome b/b6 domain-containing protein [Rhodocyclaceae bacterium]
MNAPTPQDDASSLPPVSEMVHNLVRGPEEKRRVREPVVKVWDALVRIGHWLMVIFFAIIYLRYRKFPIHAYAGYLILGIVVLRIVWGMAGTAAARFKAFWFTPKEVLGYAKDAVRGHPGYYVSHNPLGALMVYMLLTMMLVNGTLGLMLYSSGQQLGPLGTLVPEDWEDLLKYTHKVLGHLTAACVGMHIFGVLWAARQHRENYVLAMITGLKRVPRHATPEEIQRLAVAGKAQPGRFVQRLEEWFNYRYPVLGTVLLMVPLILIFLEITEAATNLNKYLYSY